MLVAHLAKLLNAADCGFMQSGTRPVCNCSAINLCISSVRRGREREREKKFIMNCRLIWKVEVDSPLTCCTDVNLRSQRSSNGSVAAGSKSAVYCLMPPDVV
jgi:hypothetical protein